MTDRTCANCACYIERVLSPLAPPQGQCRRNIAVPAQIQIEKPRLIDGKPVIGKDHKPITNKEVINTFLYAPTAPDSVCFDGWRPKWTSPGVPQEVWHRIVVANLDSGLPLEQADGREEIPPSKPPMDSDS